MIPNCCHLGSFSWKLLGATTRSEYGSSHSGYSSASPKDAYVASQIAHQNPNRIIAQGDIDTHQRPACVSHSGVVLKNLVKLS